MDTSRDPRHSRLARLHPKAYLVAHAVGGVVAILALVWAFAGLADEIPEQGWMVRGDRMITAFAQAHGTEWGETFFAIISLMGAPIMAAIVALAIGAYCLRRDWVRGGALAVTAASGGALNTLLKHIFHRGRPEFASEFIAHQTWSFPSGHAMDSVIVYGFLFVLLREQVRSATHRRALLTATGVVLALIGASRVYLGVHYLSDVIAGWLAGAAWLLVCITGYRFALTRFGARRTTSM